MTESSVISFQGYDIDPEPVGKGAYGTVHLAKAIETKEDGKIIKEEKYALKFFGYTTKCKPVNEEIDREILLMEQLKGVAGAYCHLFILHFLFLFQHCLNDFLTPH